MSSICPSYEALSLLGLRGGEYMSTCVKIDERGHLTSGVRKEATNEGAKTTSRARTASIDTFCTRNLDGLLSSSLNAPARVTDRLKSRGTNVELGGNTKTYACFRSHHDIYNSTFISLQTSSVLACDHINSLRPLCIIVHFGDAVLACRVRERDLEKWRTLNILIDIQ